MTTFLCVDLDACVVAVAEESVNQIRSWTDTNLIVSITLLCVHPTNPQLRSCEAGMASSSSGSDRRAALVADESHRHWTKPGGNIIRKLCGIKNFAG